MTKHNQLDGKYRKFESPFKLIEQGHDALNLFYQTIGQDYNPSDRHFKHSQPRMAFGRALTRHIGDSLTSDVLDKDRTTIIHYKRTHDSNLKNWDGYATFYETAEYIVDSYFAEAAKLNRIEYIDKMIAKLIKEKQQVKSTING